jgi:hypothetical protein
MHCRSMHLLYLVGEVEKEDLLMVSLEWNTLLMVELSVARGQLSLTLGAVSTVTTARAL